jgi:phenylacetic acid degradation operon negative regulatory protein
VTERALPDDTARAMFRPLDDGTEPFADLAPGADRLPRRQAGASPQNLITLLLADFGLLHHTWCPSAAIVALLAEFDVPAASARTALSRLARRDVVESAKQGRRTAYRLTASAALGLAVGGRRVASFASDAESWDGHWTLLCFSFPRDRDTDRRSLRHRLRWIGYAPLYDGLWICPRNNLREVATVLAELDVPALTLFRARHVEFQHLAHRNPVDAWDLAGIAQAYQEFLHRWQPVHDRLRSGSISGVQALTARIDVINDYRHFTALDPTLPMAQLPQNWPRNRARRLTQELYDGLGPPALSHLLATIARVAPGEDPQLCPHTFDQLQAGIPVRGTTPGQPPTGCPQG